MPVILVNSNIALDKVLNIKNQHEKMLPFLSSPLQLQSLQMKAYDMSINKGFEEPF